MKWVIGILIFLIGFVVGLLVFRFMKKMVSIGELIIFDEDSEGDSPDLFLNLNKEISDVINEDYVVVEIRRKK